MSKLVSIGVLTSGGDAPGMNAAVRAAVRAALARGLEVWAIHEGFAGLVGKGQITPMKWTDVGGKLQLGGTMIGSARCEEFRQPENRLKAARNLVKKGIGRLLVIGGDGTLTGIQKLHEEWPSHLAELATRGEIDPAFAQSPPPLHVVALAGSIDNDLFGTDMSLGADTALHRIVDAVDALVSTAASHQRTFIVEVMGRNCGYLALMAAIATGADYLLIPESPPPGDDWEAAMCNLLREGRQAGRRDSIVILAEGAKDRLGHPITADFLRKAIEFHLDFDTRVTVLGHVQRGGSPSAFDRYQGSRLGVEAVRELVSGAGSRPPLLLGLRRHGVSKSRIDDVLRKTDQVADAVKKGRLGRAVQLRGDSFRSAHDLARKLVWQLPRASGGDQRNRRLGILHAGSPAPGMNAVVQTAVRLAIDGGYEVVGIRDGFAGLRKESVMPLDWQTVEGWAARGGAELGTSNREIPRFEPELEQVALRVGDLRLDALLMIGGWAGYEAIEAMVDARPRFPSLRIPLVCVPAAIESNLPGSEVSIGADTALNNLVEVIDKIKQAAEAEHRCMVVEVMGGYCGYLALMAALTTGAELLYLHEDGVGVNDLHKGLTWLRSGFASGKRLGLVIRSEQASPYLTTRFLCDFLEAEGREMFQVRRAIPGDLQQGGNPTPFDRILAARFGAEVIDVLSKAGAASPPPAVMLGLDKGEIHRFEINDFESMVDRQWQRPKKQWWLALREMVDLLGQPTVSGP